MNRSRLLRAMSLGALLATSSPAQAQVDARVHHLFEHRARTGTTSPFFARSARFEATGRLPLLVRFRRPLTATEIRDLEQQGATFGRTLASGVRKVTAREEALQAMEQLGVIERVSPDLDPPFTLRPDSLSLETLGFAAAEASYRAKSRSPLTGKGVVIGDLDGSADIFHPALFQPLPPTDWFDADGDGVLTPEVDGIDLDGDGKLALTETFHLLNGSARSLFTKKNGLEGTEDTGYNPGWDYLYLDLNVDGVRNVGTQVTQPEKLPGLGEPIYAADDVDQDGVVQLRERIIPLGASKVRAVRKLGQDYVRGKNLSSYTPIQLAPDDADHGTAVLGTAAGGQSHHQRFAGVAPEAELLLSVYDSYGQDSEETTTDHLQWLLDQGADIVITELGQFGSSPSDGSTELELLMTAAVEQGTAVVAPTGNLGTSDKHALATLPPASLPPYENEIYLDTKYKTPPADYVLFSITWPEGTEEIKGSLETPEGESLAIDSASDFAGQSPKGRQYQTFASVTSRGAGYQLVLLIVDAQFPAQGVKVKLTSASTKEVHASLFLTDNVSGWAGGLNWKKANLPGNMVVPSFAEKVISVGAHALRVGSPWSGCAPKVGDLCLYSGLGPDLWGNRGVDLVAPDNAIAAWTDTYPKKSSKGAGKLVWGEFGGTSGAAPQLAGVLALTRQAFPELKGEALQQKVLDAAISDDQVKAGTDAMWGAGKLGMPLPPAAGQAPTVTLVAPKQAPPGSSVTLTAQVSGENKAAPLTARWDTNYDGTWDLDEQPELSTKVAMPASGSLHVKVEVIDANGWAVQATALVQPGETLPEQGGAGGTGGSTGMAGAGGSTGVGGTAGEGGTGGSSAPTAGMGAAGASPAAAAPAAASQDDDCGCEVPGRGAASGRWAWAVVGLAGAWGRRWRRRVR